MIQVQEVFHAYGDLPVLKGVSLDLKERRVGIVGANGSGKSTFARLLNGLQKPTAGTVLVDGLDTRTQGREVRRKVGFVFQNPDNQIVLPVVEEDIAFGLKNLRLPADEIERRVVETLARYDLLALRKHPAHHLSGGQKQLLAISGVLVMEPDYVVLDEPTTLLDLRNQRRVAAVIGALSQVAIVASHDLDLIRGFDRIIGFEDGEVVIDDQPSAALARYIERMA